MKKKLDCPAFLYRYSKLIDQSRILEQLIPRQLSGPRELKQMNSHLVRAHPYSPNTQAGRDPYEDCDIQAVNKCILHPIYDLLDRGGKRWRPILGMQFAECFGRDISGSISQAIAEKRDISENMDLLYACGMTEIIHNGSLIVDDIEDQSLMRRGDQCIHVKYGVDYAINTGTLMYYAPIDKLSHYVKDERVQLKLYKIYCEEMVNIHFGQNWDIYWHNGGGDKMPTEEQYFQMVVNKTSVLPRMCLRMILAILGEEVVPNEQAKTIIEYIESLGAAFQIQDDLISVLSQSYAESRGILAEDIHEGKKTLMVINSVYGDALTEQQKRRLVEILSMKTEDEGVIKEAIQIMKESGSIKYAGEMAQSMVRSSWGKLEEQLPSDSEIARRGKSQLAELSHYLVDREL